AKYDLLNPVSKLVDEAVGPAQREAKYRGQGRTLDDDEEWWTICEYPELALLNHWIYCELFHHDVDALVDPASAPKQLSLKTRILFLRFCIPDCNDKIERVPQEIVDQVCGYARSPWESSKHGTSLGCFMMIQELLYRSPSPFSSETIMDALDEEADSVDTASDSSTGSQVGPAAVVDDEEPSEPPSVELLLNTILHRPLLAFRLLLPGGEAATKADVELLRAKCDEPSAAERWTDACRSYEDQDVDLVSLGEDSTVRRDREGEVSYRQGPDGPVELRDQSLINTWKWLHIERDCGRIIWDQ
ncbi:MAG: hypothetical protein INR71_16015, partial [Terriglobus roseus]|nr:hypothetical protein [Terriglobus roseus]